ncbi:MAG: hypothetical protein NVSMB17_09190 [Candidatus Dormibacteria bacterium]
MALGLEPAPGPVLGSWLDELRGAFPELSVPPPRNLHLTLAFLGEVDGEAVARAAEAARETAAQATSFAVGWGPPGAFPSGNRPRVVWLSLADEAPTRSLQGELAQALAMRGMTLEARPYRPHLTLGRVRGHLKRERAAELGRWIETVPPPAPSMAWSLVLYRSTPGGTSQVYDELSAVPLGHPASPWTILANEQ